MFTYHVVVYLMKVDVVSLDQSGEGGDCHFHNKELMCNLRVISFQLMFCEIELHALNVYLIKNILLMFLIV